MTGPKRHVLLVAQLAPPSSLIAARRIAGLAKYLPAEGLEVTVLTSKISGEGNIEGARAVVRTSDLMASPLNWRRVQFKALEGSAAGSYSKPSRLQSVLVPDIAAATWLPFAVRTSRRLVRESECDCVITSGPPHSVHLVGLALRRRAIPWIADLRDGWTFDQPAHAFPLRAQRQLDAGLERRVATSADALVGVTKPIADDLSRRFERPATVVTNGFDPDEMADRDGRLLDPDRFSVVHTGTIAYAGSTPVPLLEAVRVLKRDRPRVAERLEVVLAGPLSAEEEPLVRAADLKDIVRHVGTLDRPRTLQLQQAADALLVVLTEGSARRAATGKLFEYLATEAPILVVGEGNEAARIVAETGTGFATSGSDPSLIASALERLVTSPPSRRDRSAVEQFSYPYVARRYAELIHEVVGQS